MFLLEGVPAQDTATFARFRSIHFLSCSKCIFAEMSNEFFDHGEISGETILIDGTKAKPAQQIYLCLEKIRNKELGEASDKTC